MGQLTRGQIVTEGMRLAGRLDLSTQAGIWFNAWLRGVYRSWTWPFLHRKSIGVALNAGVASTSFGAGSIITEEVQHIFDPIKVYSSDKRTLGLARIRQLQDGALYSDEDLIDGAETANRGLPNAMRVRPDDSLWGKWTLAPYPVADRNYLLKIEYLIQPADITSDATKPIYPADATMIQAVKVDTLNYMHNWEIYGMEKQVLDEMRGSDKVKYGSVMGINDKLTLDASVFRGRSDAPDWWNR